MKKFYGALMALLAAASFTAGIVVNESLSEDFVPKKNTLESAGQVCERPVTRLYRSSIQPEFLLSAFSRDRPETAKKKLDLNQAEEIFGRALATTNFDERLDLLDEVVFGLADDYVQDALEWSEQIPLSEDRRYFTLDLLNRWAKQDVAAALAFAEQIKAIGTRQSAIMEVVAVWQRHDFEAAFDWISSQPKDSTRDQMAYGAILSLADTDPERAAGLSTEMASPETAYQVAQVYTKWATLDPAEAAAQADRITEPQTRASAIQAVASAWAQKDLEGVMDWIGDLPPSYETRQARMTAILSCGTQDPQATAELIMENTPPGESGELIQMLIPQWSLNDFDGAMEWAKDLPSGQMRDDSLATLGIQMAFKDPKKAIELADELPSEAARANVVTTAIDSLSLNDPQAAADQIDRLSDATSRISAMHSLVRNWAAKDPERAAEYVDSLPNDKERSQVAASLMQSLSYSQPDKAAELMERYPDSVDPWVIEDIIATWRGQNKPQDEINSWIENLPQSDLQDDALASVADLTYNDDPQAALEMLSTIKNKNIREDMIFELADMWMMDDEDKAMAWIEAADLPDSIKNELTGNYPDDEYVEIEVDDIPVEGEEDNFNLNENVCFCECPCL
jgi:hypothetical protein